MRDKYNLIGYFLKNLSKMHEAGFFIIIQCLARLKIWLGSSFTSATLVYYS